MRSRQSGSIADRIKALAEAYDPDTETDRTMRAAEASAERALTRSTASLNQRFLAAGGNPNGDTGFGVLRRRTQDDVLNSLQRDAVQVRQSAVQNKIAMMSSALGASNAATSALMGASAGAASPPRDYSGSYSLLAQALEEILQGRGSGKVNPLEEALGLRVARGLM